MNAYRVTVEHGVVTSAVVVRARNADEAMDEAIFSLGLDYGRADRATVAEVAGGPGTGEKP